MEQYEATF